MRCRGTLNLNHTVSSKRGVDLLLITTVVDLSRPTPRESKKGPVLRDWVDVLVIKCSKLNVGILFVVLVHSEIHSQMSTTNDFLFD
jgi:hypothetical protein